MGLISDFKGECRTTAMGIMPHTDVERALRLALSLDIPFWPQLPNISFYEDMYAQASQNFPGITIDAGEKKVGFNSVKFADELIEYSRKMEEPETFALGKDYSAVYHRFMAEDLGKYYAIRGQVTGPVSFGFRVADEDLRPIIYNDEVRGLLFDFMQRKVNQQVSELEQKNQRAFVWMDEPGLGWVFSGLSGYSDVRAKEEYQGFLAGINGIKALHLCANVNVPYLLGMGVELLSFDAYQIDVMPRSYAASVTDFIKTGGIISWGIVPTDSTNLDKETPESIADKLMGYWEVVSAGTGLPVKQLAEQAIIAPARCCLKNIGQVGAAGESAACPVQDLTIEEQLVEKTFGYLGKVSSLLKDKTGL